MTRGNSGGPKYDALTAADFDETNEDVLPRWEHDTYCWNANVNSSQSSAYPLSRTTVDKAKADRWPNFAVPSFDMPKIDRHSTKKGQLPHQSSCKSVEDKARASNGTPFFDADDVSTESSSQCPTPQSPESGSDLKSGEAFRDFQESALHQYLWQCPSKPSPDSALDQSQYLPHLITESYKCGKRKKHVPYEINWHEDSRMGTKATSREPLVVNNESWDVESVDSEPYPDSIFEGTKADPCGSVSKTEDCSTTSFGGILRAETGEISGACRTSSSPAEEETVHITEEFFGQDSLRSSLHEHFNRLKAHIKGNLEEIETEDRLLRTSAHGSSAQPDERQDRNPSGQSDWGVIIEPSLTIKEVDAQPPVEGDTESTVDSVVMVQTGHIDFWAFQILALLVQAFIIIFVSGESVCSYLTNFWGLVVVTLPSVQIAAFMGFCFPGRLSRGFGVMFLISIWFGSVSRTAKTCKWINGEVWTANSSVEVMLDRAFADGAKSTVANALNLTNKAMNSSPNKSLASAINGTVLADTVKATVLNTTSVLVEMIAAHILNGTFSDEIKIAAADAAWTIFNTTVAELTSV